MFIARRFWFQRSQPWTRPACGLAAGLALASAAPALAHGSTYLGHPRLLFSAADVDSLRDKLQDGGVDDAAYTAMRSWATSVQNFPPHFLLNLWHGLHTVGPLAFIGWIDPAGEPFAAKVRDVVLYIARNFSVDNDEFASALRLHSMAVGYDLAFANATPAEKAEVQQEMRSYLNYMPTGYSFYSGEFNPYCSNHSITVGAAIGLATIALWDDVSPAGRDSLAAQREFGDGLIAKVLEDLVASDGSYREGVLYGGWIIRVAAPYFEARRRFDGVDLAADVRMQHMIEWLCYELAPQAGGYTNSLNDSPWASRPLALHNTVLPWAQMRWGSPLARYLQEHVVGPFGYDYLSYSDRLATALWAQPIALIDPGSVLPHGRLFADRGLYYYRSGWKSVASGNEVVFSLFSGRFFGGHAQEDQNQFTLSGYGGRWAVDCGATSATSATPKQTEAHNVVLVDGQGQHNAGNSIGTDGELASVLLSASVDYLRADASAAYATYSPFNAPGVPFPSTDWSWGYDGGNPLERANRMCLVVKDPATPPYVVVADDVKKDDATHTFDWLLHTTDTNAIDLESTPARISTIQSACEVFFAHPADLDLSWAAFQHGGSDSPTRRIQARAVAVEPRFLVALVPLPAGTAGPAFSTSTDSAAATLVLDWGSVRDVTVFDPHGVPILGEVETDGRMAFVRRDSTAVQRWFLAEGTRLACAGIELVTLSEIANVSCAGDTLHLSRDDVAFDAWAPAAITVVAPSGPVDFVRDGDRVRSPTSALGSAPVPSGLHLDIDSQHPRAGGVRLRLRLAADTRVRLRIYDTAGRLIATVTDAPLRAGESVFTWPGRDARGMRAAAGVYLAVADAGRMRAVRKLVLVP